MKICFDSSRKFLLIEPVGFQGHENFNSFFLKIFNILGQVTFIAPIGYLDACSVVSRINIPVSMGGYRTKFNARWSQVCVLRYILKKIDLDEYDAVIFLSYETISLSIVWPKNSKTFLFEHNNIDNFLCSRIKKFFYKNLSKKNVHFVFQDYIAQYLADTYGKSAICIPHPYYRTFDGAEHFLSENSSLKFDYPVIFSPSSSTPDCIQNNLKKNAQKWRTQYYIIFKGNFEEKTVGYESRPFFENYDELMQRCDFVFLGARFCYRVSGVIYEALSYGCPVILFKSPFAMELQKEYPNMVFLISSVDDIQWLVVDKEKIMEDHTRFLHAHDFESICVRVAKALGIY